MSSRLLALRFRTVFWTRTLSNTLPRGGCKAGSMIARTHFVLRGGLTIGYGSEIRFIRVFKRDMGEASQGISTQVRVSANRPNE